MVLSLMCRRYDEVYTFTADIPSNHQVRVKIDEQWVIQHWNETGMRLDGGDPAVVADGALVGEYLMRSQILCVPQCATVVFTRTFTLSFIQCFRYDIVVELRAPFGSEARISLLWESHSRTKEVIPRYWLWPGTVPLANSPYEITAA